MQPYFQKVTLWLFLSFIFVCQNSFAQAQAQALLQGAVLIHHPSQNEQVKSDRIQPGSFVKLAVEVENKGQAASSPKQIYIRYAFAKPLDKESGSVLFETEKVDLPSIPAGQSVEISFNTPHQWPALPDFIRHDWGMREYQVVIEEKIIGTLAITFSAYYYPGIRKEMPQQFS